MSGCIAFGPTGLRWLLLTLVPVARWHNLAEVLWRNLAEVLRQT